MQSVWIKICGIKTSAEARHAAECGADAVGLNFYPMSPRFLDTDRAVSIIRQLPLSVSAVGVFVGEPPNDVRAVADSLRLHAVQTYDAQCLEFDFAPVLHIPAFRVERPDTLASIAESVRDRARRGCPPAAVLVDAFVPGEFGGTGHRAPWDLLTGFDPGVPVILAGGLTPDNVADAIRAVRPAGVDVASGVESAPGVKDPGKVRAFIQAAREAVAGISVEGRPRPLRMIRDIGVTGDRGGPR
ncbi:MAG TPA: phosphoribosylanthranilate isomerase [Fimbriiglobus sp.]|nr:phosphoribosylanthranilate isomerase [Fimbriiglobus sp.]